MIDLRQFCERGLSEDEIGDTRRFLLQPFSRGDWSYATDGRLLVRVPRREDIPDNPAAPTRAESLFAEISGEPFFKAPEITLPAIDDDEECTHCDGRGCAHDCPGCQCKCRACNGSGIENPLLTLSVGYGEAILDARYIGRIKELPNLRFGKPDKAKPMRFLFDGGEGLIMPRSEKRPEHIDIGAR